jgi:hypothetical protein
LLGVTVVCFPAPRSEADGTAGTTTEVTDMEHATTTPEALSTEASDALRPADVRDRLRAAVDANAAELAARRRWATIYRGGRPPVVATDPRLRVRTRREALATSRDAA